MSSNFTFGWINSFICIARCQEFWLSQCRLLSKRVNFPDLLCLSKLIPSIRPRLRRWLWLRFWHNTKTVQCSTWRIYFFIILGFEVLYFGFSIYATGNIHLIRRRIRIMFLAFFDEVVLRRKVSFVFLFLIRIFLSLIVFKTLNLLRQRTFHINSLELLLHLLLLIKLLLWRCLFLD